MFTLVGGGEIQSTPWLKLTSTGIINGESPRLGIAPDPIMQTGFMVWSYGNFTLI